MNVSMIGFFCILNNDDVLALCSWLSLAVKMAKLLIGLLNCMAP